jgi:catechol 2,3-dioxygenase-like lactoylglutathione lyase family enzyme
MRLHHVQLAIPAGGEDAAREFWIGGAGWSEVPKPPALAGRGGCWFRRLDAEGRVLAEIHCGVEGDFMPAAKAHPALLLDSVKELEALGARLPLHGGAVDWSERHTFDGYERFHASDPFGNRIEVLAVPEATA